MIWPFTKTDTGLDQAASTLSPFITEALSGLESQVQRDQVQTRTLAECYIYGAVRYLASYDGMHPSSTAELLETMIARHFDADSNEAKNSVKYLSGIEVGGKEQLFMVEGASALRRWLVNGDRRVARELKKMLEMDVSS